MSDETTPARNPNPCPTNRRIFLQQSIVASIAASVLGASSKDSIAAVKAAASEGSAGAMDSEKEVAASPAKTAAPGGATNDDAH